MLKKQFPLAILMSCILIILLSVWLVGAQTTGQPDQPEPAAAGLVARWSMDGISGSAVQDIAGGNNGIIYGGAAPSGDSRVGAGAIALDGVNGCIRVEDSPKLNPVDAITITAWINSDTWAGKNARIVQKAGKYRLTQEWGRMIFDITAVGRLELSLPQPRQWVHIAAAYDGLQMSVYYNGKPAASMPASGPIGGPDGGTTTGDKSLYIGVSDIQSAAMNFFRGRIDDVAIFGFGMSDARIKDVYNNGAAFQAGLQAYSVEDNKQAVQQVNTAIPEIKKGSLPSSAAKALVSSLPAGRQKAQAALIIADSYRQQRKYAESLELYQTALDSVPGPAQIVYACKGAALSAIETGKAESADAAIANLLDKSEQVDSADALFQIAELYRNKNQFDKAETIYNNLTATWPQSEQAILACRRAMDYYRGKKDITSAGAWVAKLYSLPSVQPQYSFYVYEAGRDYNRAGYKAEALEIHKYNVEHFSDPHSLWSQREIAYLCIDANDIAGLESAVQRLVSVYSKEVTLNRDVYEIAQRCNSAKKLEQAQNLYKYVSDTWPGTEGAMLSQKELAFLLLDSGKDTADAAVDKLINDYAKQPGLPQEVYNIAQRYARAKQPGKAQKLYQYVVDTWPKTNNALSSKREIVYLFLDANDVASANKTADELINIYADNASLPNEIFNIAQRYSQKNLKQEALKLHRYNSGQFTKEAAGMRSQSQVIQINIKDGNNPGADAAYARLLDVFAKQNGLPDEIYRVADVYIDVNNFDKAAQLEQTVITKWPKTNSAMNAQIGIVKIHFARGSPNDADNALDTLIADYNDNTQLSVKMFNLGEVYWYKARTEQGLAMPAPATGNPIPPSRDKILNNEKTKDNYTKAQIVWERIAGDLPKSQWAAEAAFFTAETHQYLGQPEKAMIAYQRVVDNWPAYENAWRAQFRIAKSYKMMFKNGNMTIPQTQAAMKGALEKLVEKFPNTPAAAQINTKLSINNSATVEGEQK